MRCDVSYLAEVVNDALNEEEWFHMHTKNLPRGYIPDMDPSSAHRWGELTERRSGAWNAVSVACKLLEVDQARLIAVVKSMNRNERRNKYRFAVHIKDEDAFRAYVSSAWGRVWSEEYYQSTGRKMKR